MPSEQPSDRKSRPELGWTRAAVTAVLIVAVGLVALLVVPNTFLTHLTGVSRPDRVALATTWFTAALVVLAWGARRFQDRGLV